MKSLFILFYSFLIGLNALADGPKEIDKKLLQSFDSSFPMAREVTWQDRGSSYEVYFIQNGIRSKVLYPKNLGFVQLTRYYKEENLSYHVHYLIKKAFPRQSIFGITEISTISKDDNRAIVEYHLILEDATRWYRIKMNSDGSWSVVNRLRKA